MKKPICSDKFIGYFTIMGRCPYSIKEKSFMVCLFGNVFYALKTAAHEIMHLQFHEYYWKNNGHHNAKGYELMARAIYKKLFYHKSN